MSRHRFLLLVPLLLACQEGPPPATVPPLDPGPWDLVFHSDGSGEGDLLRWTPGDSTPRLLVGGPGSQHAPRWDRARRRLSWLEDGRGAATLHALDSAGSTSLGTNPGTEESVVWSPDGRWMLYSARAEGSFDLYLRPVDGSAPATRLTDDAGDDLQPAWSPDGEWIAFVSDRDGSQDVRVMPAAGGRPRTVTTTPGVAEGHPAWAPDGRRLVFDAVADGSRDADLWIQDVDGTARRRLLAAPGPQLVPTWSPSGDWIAYGSAPEGGAWDVWVVRPDGSEPTRVSQGPGFDGDPRWVPARWTPSAGG